MTQGILLKEYTLPHHISAQDSQCPFTIFWIKDKFYKCPTDASLSEIIPITVSISITWLKSQSSLSISWKLWDPLPSLDTCTVLSALHSLHHYPFGWIPCLSFSVGCALDTLFNTITPIFSLLLYLPFLSL